MAVLGRAKLPSGATVERMLVCGIHYWTISSNGEPGSGRWTNVPLPDVDPLVRVLAPDVIAALHKALPIVAALCGALAETCDEEAASTLRLLIDLTARFPAEVPT
jgi:hypothetical protein